MEKPERHIIPASAGDVARRFSYYCDATLAAQTVVVIKKNGRARNVLMSVEEYERLKWRDQQAFSAADTPEHFLADIEATAEAAKR
jgi:PHD/YefM family antitoxin component YafN of YafNO toxin-antitoxin module